MSKTAMIRARIEPGIKEQAETVLNKLGISVSEAISMFYHQIKLNKAIPFDLRIPNKETVQAMEDIRKKQHLKKYKNADDMFSKLRI